MVHNEDGDDDKNSVWVVIKIEVEEWGWRWIKRQKCPMDDLWPIIAGYYNYKNWIAG